MKSHVTDDFIDCFRKLPGRVKRLARRSHKRWKNNPSHPGLQFKRVGKRKPVYSLRVGIGWRALGIKIDKTMARFWIGPHAEYDAILPEL